jgi:hypothetical protein
VAGRTAKLERLAIEMFARGLSARDIEAAFRDDTGASVLSRTAVSQVTERLWQEYEAFATRDLSEFAVAYFFVDGTPACRGKRCSAPGVSPRTAARCCSTWPRARRKTRRAARPSSRTSSAAAYRIRSWPSPTARRA